MNRIAPALLALSAAAAALAGEIAPVDVARQMRDPGTAPFLLDVRTPAEFADGRVPGAKNIPVQELAARLAEVPRDRPVVVYCASGARARRAHGLLRDRGYGEVSEMQGSMRAWEAAKLPVEK